MTLEELQQQLINDFAITNLEEEDKEEMLEEIAKTVLKQYLNDIYSLVGEKQFEALQASASMGTTFYQTTLKHLVPNHEEVFALAKKKVLDAFNATA